MTPAGWLTCRELDERAGVPKGSAFRAFRRLEPELAEDRDYRVLSAAAPQVEQLRAAARIYRSSVHVVLVSPAVSNRLLRTLAAR